MIATDLSKQQAVDTDPKAMQQIKYTGNLAQNPVANTTMFFITEEAKETVLDFSQGTVKVAFFFFFALTQNDPKEHVKLSLSIN